MTDSDDAFLESLCRAPREGSSPAAALSGTGVSSDDAFMQSLCTPRRKQAVVAALPSPASGGSQLKKNRTPQLKFDHAAGRRYPPEMSRASLAWKTSHPERVQADEDAANQSRLPISFALKNTGHDCKEALLAIIRGHPGKQVYVGTTTNPIRRWSGDTREEFLRHREEHPEKKGETIADGPRAATQA